VPLAETLLVVLAAGAAAAPSARNPLTAGDWGGPHAQLEIAPDETRIELDCAHGVIAGALAIDHKGRVDSIGSVVRRNAGPGPETDAGEGEPARFQGRLQGKVLTLHVTLVGSAEELGTFQLQKGRPGRLGACP
jgi:hypothetical protein